MKTVALAITGASGAPYAIGLLQRLLQAACHVYLMISDAGRQVLEQESGLRLPARPAEIRALLEQHFGSAAGHLEVFGRQQWSAPVASGSGVPEAMVICPCSMASLSAVAHGASRNLIERAADVVLKERRRLILVPRETPFSVIHIENMLRLARAGAVIMPPNPGFYHQPSSMQDLVDFVVARLLDHLDIHHDLVPAWGRSDDD